MSLVGKKIIILDTGSDPSNRGITTQPLSAYISKGDTFEIVQELGLNSFKLKHLRLAPIFMKKLSEADTLIVQYIGISQFKELELLDILEDIRKEI